MITTFMNRFGLVSAVLWAALGTAGKAQGAELAAAGRLEACCDGYWSTVDGIFELTFRDESLPWGSTVTLHYGWQVSEWQGGNLVVRSEWQDISDLGMTADGPYLWRARLRKQVHARSASTTLTALDYAFRIRLPDGRTVWEKGSDSPLGYFRSPVPRQEAGCYPWTAEYCALPVTPVVNP